MPGCWEETLVTAATAGKVYFIDTVEMTDKNS